MAPKRKTEATERHPAKLHCINCGAALCGRNMERPPYLCWECQKLWERGNEVGFSKDVWLKTKDMLVVAISMNNLTGVYDKGYGRLPLHLGFLSGYLKRGGLRFFQPVQVYRILKHISS